MHFSSISVVALLAAATSASQTVYLIRHGEKPADGGNGLNIQGEQRAQCLRNVFGSQSQYNIGYIIAEQPKSSGKRTRPLKTVQPVAADLGLTVDTSCEKEDAKCVAKLVSAYNAKGSSKNILICWEHNILTDIAEALGNKKAPSYPDESFNLIWTDPQPYKTITAVTSENCPGLD